MEKINLTAAIHYDVENRECIAVMDEIKITSGMYAGTVFAVIMDQFGRHDMIHESRIKNWIYLNPFNCYDAHSIRRLLIELSFVNDLRSKKQFITGYQLLNF